MNQPEVVHDEAAEIIRCASVALGGSPVAVWEARNGELPHLYPLGGVAVVEDASAGEIETAIRAWAVPVSHGSRWLTARSSGGKWVIARVRNRPAAPPPEGRERRCRERLTLELAGLCLGLVERRNRPGTGSLQELVGLPAMIAHEAGNPLTSARAGLQLALESLRAPGDLDADRRTEVIQDLSQVVDDIDRTVSFLRAVQDRARGAFTRVERFDAVRVIRSCLTLEERLLRDRRMTLHFEDHVESAYLTGDPSSLFEALINLLRNAVDAYEGKAGTIDVRLTRVADRLELCVRDHGMGIPADHLPLVFDPGFTTKEFGKGSGMGLALVRSVIQEVFGGSVQVESASGKGTAFTVALPVPPQRRT